MTDINLAPVFESINFYQYNDCTSYEMWIVHWHDLNHHTQELDTYLTWQAHKHSINIMKAYYVTQKKNDLKAANTT